MINGHSIIKALAWDLDGTLVDTARDIGLALNTALARSGLERVDMASVRTWIGDGPDVLISRALTSQGLDNATEEMRICLRRDFDEATLIAPLVEGEVFPGVAAFMQTLHQQVPMVVVTNKPTALARAVLDAAGLLPLITRVWGADAPEDRKPAPTLLRRAATTLNISPAQLLMIGDGPADLLSAQAAGCPAVLVSWGYGAHAIPADMRTDRIDLPAELLHRLTQPDIRLEQQGA